MTSLTLETGVAGTDSSLKFDCLSIKEAERIELITLNKIDFATFSLENNQDSQGANDRNGQVRTLHYKPTTKELLKASFVSFSFLAIIPFIFTIYDYVSEFYNVKAHRDEFLEVMLQSYWVFSLIIVFFILAAIVFGIIRTFLKYGKYEILSDEEKIYINKGIWKEISFSIQKNKVQAIQIQQSFLKRLLKIAEVKIISSGSSGELENQTNSLFPFMPVNQIQSVLKELLPDYKIDTAMHTLPKNLFSSGLFVQVIFGSLYQPLFLYLNLSFGIYRSSICFFLFFYESLILKIVNILFRRRLFN